MKKRTKPKTRATLPNPLVGGKKKPLKDGIRFLAIKAQIEHIEKLALEGKNPGTLAEQLYKICLMDSGSDYDIGLSLYAQKAIANLLKNDKCQGAVMDMLLLEMVGNDVWSQITASMIMKRIFDDHDEKTEMFIIQRLITSLHSENLFKEMENNSPVYVRIVSGISHFLDDVRWKFDPTPDEIEMIKNKLASWREGAK